jgi:hypothetical protein
MLAAVYFWQPFRAVVEAGRQTCVKRVWVHMFKTHRQHRLVAQTCVKEGEYSLSLSFVSIYTISGFFFYVWGGSHTLHTFGPIFG